MSIIDRARSWIEQDPDPETRRELESLIERGDEAALEERFSGTLRFGTAGLRGWIGAGPTRMNRVTVSKATAGLCVWLKREVPEAASRGIVVGRDARTLSDVFERDVVEIATAAGIRVMIFDDVVPTPLLAFAALSLHAAGGVMITASHNPPGYNGYKVYWENGAQIIPPNDSGIAAEIERTSGARELPRLSIEKARAQGLLRSVDDLREQYVERIVAEMAQPANRGQIRVAYTALHGVAERTFRAVMARAGFEDVQSVADQATPDPSFPTVAFPNPEEPGAMDEVLALAERIKADLAIANDPDGDRMAVAARSRGRLEMLSGNEVGILLADELLSRPRDSGQPLVISTIVSSPMLGAIAASHGARWEQTLTGHKWIQNRALELEAEGLDYVFGYEQALGYAPSLAVRDKDGISSALCIVELASRLDASSHTLHDALNALWCKHGFFADRQLSVRFEGTGGEARMERVIDRYRDEPPSRIGGQAVLRMLDLQRQQQWSPLGVTPFRDLAPSNVLIFELRGGHRAMLRPSGTEPKLKYYFYATARVPSPDELPEAKAQALAVLEHMVADLTSSSNC